jgi:hypothetical protein
MEEKIMKYFLPLSQYKNGVCESGGSNPLLTSLAGEHVMNPRQKSPITHPLHGSYSCSACDGEDKNSNAQARKQTLTTHSESYHLIDCAIAAIKLYHPCDAAHA